MQSFIIGNLFLLGSILSAAASQVLVKQIINVGQFSGMGFGTLIEILEKGLLGKCVLAVVLMGVGYLLWLACLTRLNLSFAYPVACSSVLLVAIFSIAFLGETFSLKNWLGTVLILIGILFLLPGKETV